MPEESASTDALYIAAVVLWLAGVALVVARKLS